MSFQITLQNQTTAPSSSIHWAIVGKDSSGNFFHLDPGGTATKMATSDNTTVFDGPNNCNGKNQFADYFVALDANPSFTIPDSLSIDSGQIWISIGSSLPFCVISATAFAPPSVTNPGLQGYATPFQTVELAFNLNGSHTLNINTTSVDAMGIPVTLVVNDNSGPHSVSFTSPRSAIVQAFQNCPEKSFQSLVIPQSQQGQPALRVLSPEHAARDANGNPPPPDIGIPTSAVDFFSSFYDAYIASCWKLYATKPLTIHIASQAFTGQVQNDVFVFHCGLEFGRGDVAAQITHPANWEVLQCAGQFKEGSSDEEKNVKKFVVAALYRTVLHLTPTESDDSWSSPAMVKQYYTNPPINHYALILHQLSENNLCYALAFDDVCNQSASLVSTTTQSVVLTLPAW